MRYTARYHRWLATLVDHRKTTTSPGMWLGTAAFVLLILVLTSYVRPIADWFQLRFWPALFCFLPSFLYGVAAGRAEQQGQLSLNQYGLLILGGCSLLQFFFAALIALSVPPGSFVLSSLYVLTLAVHGYVNRASLHYPYMLLGATAAAVAALLLSPTPQTLSIFAFVVPTALIVMMMSGQVGVREHLDRQERDKLKQAIHYKTLNERIEAHEQMSKRVMDMLSYNHDAANTLSTVFMNAQLLGEALAELPPSTPESVRVIQHNERLLQQLDVLKSLISLGHSLADGMPTIAPVPLFETIDEVTRDCKSLFPAAAITVVRPDTSEELSVRVHEGATGLRRILENILHNACEGNGTDAARSVRVEVDGGADTVLIRCIDDGPGFEPEQLEAPVTPFVTTKPDGHGLGLFSVSHLVWASGGAVTLGNRQSGGAVVDIQFVRDRLD